MANQWYVLVSIQASPRRIGKYNKREKESFCPTHVPERLGVDVSRGVLLLRLDHDEIGFSVLRIAIPIRVVGPTSPEDVLISVLSGHLKVHFHLAAQRQVARSGGLGIHREPIRLAMMAKHFLLPLGQGKEKDNIDARTSKLFVLG